MKKLLFVSLVLLFGVTSLLTIAGCQQESNTDLGKMRFISNENRKLKVQLTEQEAEIDNCLQRKTAFESENKKLKDELTEQKTETNRCMKEKTALENENKKLKGKVALQDARIEGYVRQLADPEKEYQGRINDMAQAFMQIVQDLKEENDALQQQIEELKKQP